MVNLPGGGQVKIIAGNVEIDGKTIAGPIQGISTKPFFLDVRLQAGGYFTHPHIASHNAFVYLYEGRVEIGSVADKRLLEPQSAGVLSPGDNMVLS